MSDPEPQRRYDVRGTFSNPLFWTGCLAARDESEIARRAMLTEIRLAVIEGKPLRDIPQFARWLAYPR